MTFMFLIYFVFDIVKSYLVGRVTMYDRFTNNIEMAENQLKMMIQLEDPELQLPEKTLGKKLERLLKKLIYRLVHAKNFLPVFVVTKLINFEKRIR